MLTHSPTPDKSMLVDLGVACLALGEWAMVAALTRLIQRRALRHA
jgi:hypothetical protein